MVWAHVVEWQWILPLPHIHTHIHPYIPHQHGDNTQQQLNTQTSRDVSFNGRSVKQPLTDCFRLHYTNMLYQRCTMFNTESNTPMSPSTHWCHRLTRYANIIRNIPVVSRRSALPYGLNASGWFDEHSKPLEVLTWPPNSDQILIQSSICGMCWTKESDPLRPHLATYRT